MKNKIPDCDVCDCKHSLQNPVSLHTASHGDEIEVGWLCECCIDDCIILARDNG
jgi:hypothetical protein